MADTLRSTGHVRSPEWIAALEAVPRHELLRSGVFRHIDGPDQSYWEPITPERSGEQTWLEVAYGDDSLVIQLDGSTVPADVPEPVAGNPTSSTTMPSLVVRMLEDLQVSDIDAVLEIGTGTGYSTALMCHRLGSGHVTSVEIDPAVSAQAGKALSDLGYAPTLVVGDGLDGHPDNAPYDRVIATCSVRRLPAAWIEQTRPGGLILATVTGWMHGSALARLTVTGAGTAEGGFLPGDVSFMIARPQAAPGNLMINPLTDTEPRPARVGPEILDTRTGRFVAQLGAPYAQHLYLSLDDSLPAHYLIDTHHDARAVITQEPDGSSTVYQSGPVALWDDIERAIETWQTAGCPTLDRFRIEVATDRQVIQLGPGARWELT